MDTQFKTDELRRPNGARSIVQNFDTLKFLEQLKACSSSNEPVPPELLMDLNPDLRVSDFKNLRLYSTWNELTLELAVLFQNMKSEAYVASRYFDFRISEAGLKAAARGCKFNILHSDRAGLTTKLQVYGNLITHPRSLRIFKQVLKSPNMSIKEATFPYSFVVIDSSIVGMELVSPKDPDSFFLGLKLESSELASKLITHFQKLANDGAQDQRQEVLRKSQSAIVSV